MNALRRWLYRGTLSCAMCFLIALTLYNRTNHVNVKYHKPPMWNCHSEDKHTIGIGILIPSTTKYINMCSVILLLPLIIILNNCAIQNSILGLFLMDFSLLYKCFLKLIYFHVCI